MVYRIIYGEEPVMGRPELFHCHRRVLRIVTLQVQAQEEVAIGGQGTSHLGKCPHYLHIYLDRDLKRKDAAQHRNTQFGESKGPCPAPSPT